MESLLQAADAAMYHAKRDHGQGYCFFQAGMKQPMADSVVKQVGHVVQHSDIGNVSQG